MDHQRLEQRIDEVLTAWNSQDVERVVGCYTEDVRYSDPNTRGFVEGRDALRRYLARLFGAWEMTWARREVHQLSNDEGVAFLWHATFRRSGGSLAVVGVDGMDLALLRGDLLARNEVYFDRTLLAQLAP